MDSPCKICEKHKTIFPKCIKKCKEIHKLQNDLKTKLNLYRLNYSSGDSCCDPSIWGFRV